VKPPLGAVDGNEGESQPRNTAEAMTIATNFMAGTIVSHGPPAERMSSATWRKGALARSPIWGRSWPFKINALGLVDQNSASWNRVVDWIRQLNGLRRAA
jgi:hypothetical protein